MSDRIKSPDWWGEFLGDISRPPPPNYGPLMDRVNQDLDSRAAAGEGIDPDVIEAFLASANQMWDGNVEAIPANLWRWGTSGPDEWEAFDPNLTYGDVVSAHGFEGLRGVAAQGAMGVLEPGPGDLIKSLGLLAGIPRNIQSMIAKRLHPSMVDHMGLPHQQYHGTVSTFDTPHPVSTGYVAPAHHTTRSPRYASGYAKSTSDPRAVNFRDENTWSLVQDRFSPQVRMETPVLRNPLVRGEVKKVTHDQLNEFMLRLENDYGILASNVFGEEMAETSSLMAALGDFETSIIREGGIRVEDVAQFNRRIEGIFGYEGNDLIRRAFLGIGIDGYIDDVVVGRGTTFMHRGLPEASGEFLSFNPTDDLIRANHPEDAIRWLLRQRDLTPAERSEVLTVIEQLNLTDLLGEP